MTNPMIDYQNLLSKVGRALQPNAIRKLTKLLGRGDVISLAAGAPSTQTFPIEELAEISSRVIREPRGSIRSMKMALTPARFHSVGG